MSDEDDILRQAKAKKKRAKKAKAKASAPKAPPPRNRPRPMTNSERMRAEDTRREGGVRIVGADCAVIYRGQRRRVGQ